MEKAVSILWRQAGLHKQCVKAIPKSKAQWCLNIWSSSKSETPDKKQSQQVAMELKLCKNSQQQDNGTSFKQSHPMEWVYWNKE